MARAPGALLSPALSPAFPLSVGLKPAPQLRAGVRVQESSRHLTRTRAGQGCISGTSQRHPQLPCSPQNKRGQREEACPLPLRRSPRPIPQEPGGSDLAVVHKTCMAEPRPCGGGIPDPVTRRQSGGRQWRPGLLGGAQGPSSAAHRQGLGPQAGSAWPQAPGALRPAALPCGVGDTLGHKLLWNPRRQRWSPKLGRAG